MDDIAESLRGFGARANELLRETWGFTLSLNNVLPYSPVAWNSRALDPVPFSRPMLRLESELKTVAGRVMAAQDRPGAAALGELYAVVEPAFRATVQEEHDECSWADAISLYQEQQQILLLTYARGKTTGGRSFFQDIFLRQLATQAFPTHPYLMKESLDRAGRELTAYAGDFLRALQRVYLTDIEGVFRRYHALLLDIHEALCEQPIRVPTYKGLAPRRIPGTGSGVPSKFIGGMREMPALEEAQREQILRLRDADGSAEKDLYRKLVRSRDWGEELKAVVAYMQQRNQDPLTRYKVFEAGLQGELEPVEIAEASSEQVIGQEKNVARLRTLLGAFVRGSHLPFILLEGEGGVGKTLSLQALVREIEGLKLVLINSDYLGQIRQYAQKMAEQPWRTVLYIDDMTFDPRHYESFKTGTQGMKRFYDNVTVMASANPSALAHLPPDIMRRWPIRIKYSRPDLSDSKTLQQVLQANCERVRIDYDPRLATAFRRLHKTALRALAPSAVYDFLQEVKVTRGL